MVLNNKRQTTVLMRMRMNEKQKCKKKERRAYVNVSFTLYSNVTEMTKKNIPASYKNFAISKKRRRRRNQRSELTRHRDLIFKKLLDQGMKSSSDANQKY